MGSNEKQTRGKMIFYESEASGKMILYEPEASATDK